MLPSMDHWFLVCHNEVGNATACFGHSGWKSLSVAMWCLCPPSLQPTSDQNAIFRARVTPGEILHWFCSKCDRFGAEGFLLWMPIPGPCAVPVQISLRDLGKRKKNIQYLLHIPPQWSTLESHTLLPLCSNGGAGWRRRESILQRTSCRERHRTGTHHNSF